MTVCTGRGARGDHCCYIDGKVCFYYDDGCSVLAKLGSWDAVHADKNWKRSKVGQYFAETYPGYGCGDWPQNIPEVMAKADVTGPFGPCCWGRGNL